MYRSLALTLVLLHSAAAWAGDFPSSVYVAPGGVYAPSSRIYVGPRSVNPQPPYVERSYDGYPPYAAPGYRAPASVYGYGGPVYASPPVYIDDEYGRGYASEYAPRPPLPVPYAARERCFADDGRWTYCP